MNDACITGLSPRGHCGAAYYCLEPYDCCAACPKKGDCNIRCGWPEVKEDRPMHEFIDLETGQKCRDEAHANELYEAGHRIKVYQDGKEYLEWIPGSNDYYWFYDGKKYLTKYDESSRPPIKEG